MMTEETPAKEEFIKFVGYNIASNAREVLPQLVSLQEDILWMQKQVHSHIKVHAPKPCIDLAADYLAQSIKWLKEMEDWLSPQEDEE